MKKLCKFFAVILIALSLFTMVSCDKDKGDKNNPFGDVDFPIVDWEG